MTKKILIALHGYNVMSLVSITNTGIYMDAETPASRSTLYDENFRLVHTESACGRLPKFN